jgi:large-conductance mechanosensitive channel
MDEFINALMYHMLAFLILLFPVFAVVKLINRS